MPDLLLPFEKRLAAVADDPRLADVGEHVAEAASAGKAHQQDRLLVLKAGDARQFEVQLRDAGGVGVELAGGDVELTLALLDLIVQLGEASGRLVEAAGRVGDAAVGCVVGREGGGRLGGEHRGRRGEHGKAHAKSKHRDQKPPGTMQDEPAPTSRGGGYPIPAICDVVAGPDFLHTECRRTGYRRPP